MRPCSRGGSEVAGNVGAGDVNGVVVLGTALVVGSTVSCTCVREKSTRSESSGEMCSIASAELLDAPFASGIVGGRRGWTRAQRHQHWRRCCSPWPCGCHVDVNSTALMHRHTPPFKARLADARDWRGSAAPRACRMPSSSSPQATPKSGWIRAQRSTSATPVKTGRDECVLFPWQQDLDAHLPKYRKLAHMSPARTFPTTPPPRRYRAPLRLERGSARVERKADTFAMVKEVWRGAMDTPSAATPAPARKPETRQAQQTTLDAFTRPTTKTTHVPESRALPPSPPDSLSSCSTIPGDSDDEIASPARTWIRALGSSPSEWLHSSP